MTHYQRGDYREKRAKEYLESLGYVCWQARGSRGVVDIIALKRNAHTLLVQVKSGNARIQHYEWNRLYRLADTLGARGIVVTTEGTPPKVKMLWRVVLDVHTAYSSVWPSRPVFT